MLIEVGRATYNSWHRFLGSESPDWIKRKRVSEQSTCVTLCSLLLPVTANPVTVGMGCNLEL